MHAVLFCCAGSCNFCPNTLSRFVQARYIFLSKHAIYFCPGTLYHFVQTRYIFLSRHTISFRPGTLFRLVQVRYMFLPEHVVLSKHSVSLCPSMLYPFVQARHTFCKGTLYLFVQPPVLERHVHDLHEKVGGFLSDKADARIPQQGKQPRHKH